MHLRLDIRLQEPDSEINLIAIEWQPLTVFSGFPLVFNVIEFNNI